MYLYDIPYPKKGQMALTFNGVNIICSKIKSYLIEKMKAYQDEVYDNQEIPKFEYEIVTYEGESVYRQSYLPGERGNASTPYFKSTPDPVHYVERNGFRLISDDNENVLTDEALLEHLYNFRFVTHFPVIVSNRALVGMATYKPMTKEEFVKIKGLGEKVYDKCGEQFLAAIRSYMEGKK